MGRRFEPCSQPDLSPFKPALGRPFRIQFLGRFDGRGSGAFLDPGASPLRLAHGQGVGGRKRYFAETIMRTLKNLGEGDLFEKTRHFLGRPKKFAPMSAILMMDPGC